MTEAERQIIALLTDIRNLLSPTIVEDVGCPHPEQARISLKAMGTKGEHWKCGACGFEQRPAES